MTEPRGVVLDANVLFGAQIRDMLLRLALPPFPLYRPVWSGAILDELMRNLHAKAGMPADALDHLRAQMLSQFPGSSVEPNHKWLSLLPNQAKDRHVLATALAAGTRTIVTANTRHFHGAPWFGVQVQTPDQFLCELHDENPEAVAQTLREQAAELVNPRVTPGDLIARMPRIGIPKLAARLRRTTR
jgi:predicted nucleic acid-binding protein